MTRKIAFGITLVATVLLMLLELNVLALPAAFALGSMTVETAELLPYAVTVLMAVISVLCYSRNSTLCIPKGVWSSVMGWFATFTGVILSLLLFYDIFCTIAYPSAVADNSFETATSWLMMLFGLAGGVMLVMQGFRWMSFAKEQSSAVQWLSITPAVWMWFRLARYEISFSSTVDISENFFVLSMLVFASLFFLQLARMIAGVGKQPKNSLLIFALLTAMVGIAQAPASILYLTAEQPLSDLLALVADTVVAVFALIVAALQIFGNPEEATQTAQEETATDDIQDEELPAAQTTDAEDDVQEQDDPLVWNDPPRKTEPVDPPFQIDSVLPSATAACEPETPAPTATDKVSVDDLLNEIDSL